MFFIPVCFLVSWCEASYPILSYAWCVCWLLDCSSFSCVCCMFALLCGPCVPCVLHVPFFEFFLAFGCCTIFAFGMRGKMGAWAPDIVAGGGGNKWPQMLHSVPVGGNNYGAQGERGSFFAQKITFFFSFSRKSVKLLAVIGPGYSPGEKCQENSPIFEQQGARPLNKLCITPTTPVL